MRKRSHGVGKRLTSVLLLGASLILVTVGYAGFGVIESGSNNSADLVFVSVDDEGASNITLGKLGIEITGTSSQFTFNSLYEYEYSYDYFSDSDHDNEAYDISTESDTYTTTTSKTIVNGTIKIGLTVNLDSSYDSGATDDVPNIANLDYDNSHYANLKVVFGFSSTDVQDVTATIYPTNFSSRYSTMTALTPSSGDMTMTYKFPLKSATTTSLYNLATLDTSYPKYTNGVLSDYKVPITIEFDCTGISTLSSSSFYSPTSSTPFTATFSIEGDA